MIHMTHRLNRKPRIYDPRNYKLTRPSNYSLPDEVDFYNMCQMPGIRDQGNEGSCTGFGITSSWEIQRILAGEPSFEPSPAAEYYWERVIEGDTSQDNGAMVQDGLKVLLHTGVIPETEFPYLAGQYMVAPQSQAITDAAANEIKSYSELTSLDDVLYALATKSVVIVGFTVYPSFEQVGSDGNVPMPSSSEQSLGGHCTKLVGFDTHTRRLKMPNQWGTSWANNGICYVPFEYCDFNHLIDEAWVIQV